MRKPPWRRLKHFDVGVSCSWTVLSMASQRINSMYCTYRNLSLLLGLTIVCVVGGCWREVEYTAPRRQRVLRRKHLSRRKMLAVRPSHSRKLSLPNRARNDSKAAAGSDDLAATLSAERRRPTSQPARRRCRVGCSPALVAAQSRAPAEIRRRPATVIATGHDRTIERTERSGTANRRLPTAGNDGRLAVGEPADRIRRR